MKPLGILLLALCFAVSVHADDSVQFIPVKWSASEPTLDPLHISWLKQPATVVSLYPQASVPPATALNGATPIRIRAQYSAKTVALHLEWAEGQPAKDRAIGQFADAAAVQWPVRYGPGVALPYVGMGHAGAPVALWFWRADGSVETLAAEGFGTLAAQTSDGVKVKSAWKDGAWRVVYARTLSATGDYRISLAPVKLGLVPVAFATWHGRADERNGLKRLSAWQVLRFEKGKVDTAYAKQFDVVASVGNADNGKRLMSEKGCTGCHSSPANAAKPRIGPDLTYAGGIHSVQYLTESLREPSRVVVPGKGYFIEQDGKKASLMPPLTGTEQELQDLVAFLVTLR
jgi:complex iron-sulfur molybdoenzyme family reductase subunit gamma